MIEFWKQCVFLLVVLTQLVNLQYAGQDFPVKYLEPDGEIPTDSDVKFYLDTLSRMTKYLTDNANSTDINQAFSSFMAVAVLKRTLKDYRYKMEPYEKPIKVLIDQLMNIIAHYRFNQKVGGWKNTEFKMARAMEDDFALVYSLRNFKKGVLTKWLLRFVPLNNFISAMDRLTLPKEKYVQLVEDTNGSYHITGPDSDLCLSRLCHNIDVFDNITLHPCEEDVHCKEKIFLAPSVAYSLSHRFLNAMMYLHSRRCYHHSPGYDASHLDLLCAAMYREAVYIARRGYFSRDVFMEHVGFCGQLGYEEFHRRNWFHKTAKWIDEKGCMQEDSNFELNRTKYVIANTVKPDDTRKIRSMWRRHYEMMLEEDCHTHQMAVALMVLTNAVRHAAHFMKDPVN